MIPRYTRPEMAEIWSAESRFQIWLEIETYACEAQAELGVIPKTVPEALRKKGGFNIARIDEIEAEVKHDVIAFLTSLAEHVGEDARFVHQGMTSSDVLDTCLAVQMSRATHLLLEKLSRLLNALRQRAEDHVETVCIGRSHGIHAEPTTFGIKLASHYAAFARGQKRLQDAHTEIATCAISGAVGTFANIDPYVEAYVANKLSLRPEPVSTQIIPRDRHAHFIAVLGGIAASIENLAVEIRHLQRTEVREAEEFFSSGQKGSSAMPHKRNPILSENLTGLSRVVRAAIVPAYENVVQWHERDIAHSSVERIMLPDALLALDFALARLTGLIENLVVRPEAMQKNLNKMGGLVHSQQVLLALTQAGCTREDAYKLVQKNAMRVWEDEGEGKSLRERLSEDSVVMGYLSVEALNAAFDFTIHTQHAKTLLKRAFAEGS